MWKPILELTRVEENFTYGTFGYLRINKEVFCVTLEPRDELNARNISSIPAQQYMCRRTKSPRFGETFEVCDVPGRDHVLFHPLNLVTETEGCIGLAQHWGKLKGNRAILNSGATFRRFMEAVQNFNELHLTIKEDY